MRAGSNKDPARYAHQLEQGSAPSVVLVFFVAEEAELELARIEGVLVLEQELAGAVQHEADHGIDERRQDDEEQPGRNTRPDGVAPATVVAEERHGGGVDQKPDRDEHEARVAPDGRDEDPDDGADGSDRLDLQVPVARPVEAVEPEPADQPERGVVESAERQHGRQELLTKDLPVHLYLPDSLMESPSL